MRILEVNRKKEYVKVIPETSDDFHQTASIKNSEVENAIKMIYVCKKCKSENVLYWGEQKVLGMGF